MVNENEKIWLKTYKGWQILYTVYSGVLWSIMLAITLKNKLLHHSFNHCTICIDSTRMTFEKNND